MLIEKLSIAALFEDPKNARKHSVKNLKAIKGSLSKFGQQKPIVIDKKNMVIAGNGTLQAAKELGWEAIDIVRTDLTGSQIKAYAAADNRTGELAEWDDNNLAALLKELQDENFDLDAIGFSEEDLAKWLKSAEEFEPGCDEDELPEEVETRSKPGDIWQLDGHRVMCGDSTNIQHVEKLMNGTMAALVITDPPYNVAVNDESEASLKARNRRTDGLKIQNDKMDVGQFKDFLTSVFTNYWTVMHEGASIYVFYADSMTIEFMTTFMNAGFHFAQNCIWNKQQFVMTRKDYHYKHEPCLYGWKKGKAHSWMADRKQSSVWCFDRPFKNELHPTMKPIPLIEYPLVNSSAIGSIVLDLFLGSGSTLIACEKTGRKCYGMEIDPKYTDVILARWEKFSGKQAVLL